jgi:hypothetical protein
MMIVYSRLVVLYVLMPNVPREFALASLSSFFTLYTSYFDFSSHYLYIIYLLTKNKNY